MPAGNSYDTSPGGEPRKPSAGIMGYTIRELLQKINDRDGVPSFQAVCCGTPSLDEFILYQGRPE